MALQLFAAIYIGSYEVSLKIFEQNSKNRIREIDHVRSRQELGRDVITTGGIGYEQVEKLCDTLAEFLEIMRSYRVDKYEACASAVIREAANGLFVLEQIHLRTRLSIKVLSNSEHRFISYRSMAERPLFERMIRTSAVVLDVGGTGIQISLFREGELITTQFMDIGTIRLRALRSDGHTLFHYEKQMEEYIDKELESFCMLYAEEGVENVIFMNDYVMEIARKVEKNRKEEEPIKAERYIRYIDGLLRSSLEEIARELNLSNDKDALVVPSMLLFRETLLELGVKSVWVPGLNINDGIFYDYAQRNGLIKPARDFEKDILSAARSLAEHYRSPGLRIEELEEIALRIFDSMKKIHGLGKRERLLLRVAAIVHDCGKYINTYESVRCSWHIVMASEIIGLSHLERQIVAYSVLYSALPLEEYARLSAEMDRESYLVVAKLSAILQAASVLERSFRRKFSITRIAVKGRELVFSLESTEDISLEKTLFGEIAYNFESVFSLRPVIREKRIAAM